MTLSLLKGLLNPPDLILIAALLFFIISGARRGFLYTLVRFVSRFVALAGAVWLAKLLSPAIAKITVLPLARKLFEERAAQAGLSGGVLEALRETVSEAAQSMGESLVFIVLLVALLIGFSLLLRLLLQSLRFLSRHLKALGLLDGVAGAALGAALGLGLICAVLVGASLVYPIVYTDLGLLSPDRVSQTMLLAALIGRLPIAI